MAIQAAWEKDDCEIGWLLAELAGVSDVEFSEKAGTACIKRSGERYSILFAKSFVQRYLSTPDDVLFVLLHEIMHKIRGDLVRDIDVVGPVEQHVLNVAEDMLINAELCLRFFETPPPFFEALYDGDSFPGVLLTPPALLIEKLYDKGRHSIAEESFFEEVRQKLKEWIDEGTYRPNSNSDLVSNFNHLVFGHFEALSGLPHREELLEDDLDEDLAPGDLAKFAYIDAWFHFSKQNVEILYEWIRPLFPFEEQVVIVLGDHSDKDCPLPGWDDVFDEKGGHSDIEEDEKINVEVSPRHVSRVARLLKKALEPDPANPVESMLMQPEKSVVPWMGRCESLWMAKGLWPVFFNTPTYTRNLEYIRPHLYIDVSGSTKEQQPMIYGLVAHLADIIGGPVYLFSNTVAEASMEDIKKGKMTTTGGTDFDCVIEHAVKNRFRKIVIMTDGCAEMNGTNRSKITSGEIQLYILFTNRRRYYDPEDLIPLAKEVFYME
jgi:hypothetical protein